MIKNLEKIELSISQKSLLEVVSGKKILLRNSFEKNQKEISQLQKLAVQNAQIYLQRNKLEQRLSLFEENNLYQNLLDLQKLLNLKKVPRRIECYDISHLSGTFVYGSMVTFLDGVAVKKFYRLFKCPNRNDDFANHYEVLSRRLKRGVQQMEKLENRGQVQKAKSKKQKDLEGSLIPDLKGVGGMLPINESEEFSLPGRVGGTLVDSTQIPELQDIFKKDLQKQFLKERQDIGWELPDLIIVDGGKGQLSSDFKALNEFNLQNEIELVGLAKKEEEIFVLNPEKLSKSSKFGSQGGVLLNGSVKFLIQRIRDEAHRFAIENNRRAKLKTAQKSRLDKVPGVVEKTKIKLLQVFGSSENIVESLFKNPELVYETAGKKVTENLKKFFGVMG